MVNQQYDEGRGCYEEPFLHWSVLLGCCASEYDYEAEPQVSDVEVDSKAKCQEPPKLHFQPFLDDTLIKGEGGAQHLGRNSLIASLHPLSNLVRRFLKIL